MGIGVTINMMITSVVKGNGAVGDLLMTVSTAPFA